MSLDVVRFSWALSKRVPGLRLLLFVYLRNINSIAGPEHLKIVFASGAKSWNRLLRCLLACLHVILFLSAASSREASGITF